MKRLLLALVVACTPTEPPDSAIDARLEVDAAPFCQLCDAGPECARLAAICVDVESNSAPLLCDEGATLAPHEFTTFDPADGTTLVTCRCGTLSCGPE